MKAFRSAYPLPVLHHLSPPSRCTGGGMAGRMKHFLCEAELLCQVKSDTSHPLQQLLVNFRLKILWDRILFDAVYQWSITAVIYSALKNIEKKYYGMQKGGWAEGR